MYVVSKCIVNFIDILVTMIASMFIKKAVFNAFGLADGGYVSNGIRPFAAGLACMYLSSSFVEGPEQHAPYF